MQVFEENFFWAYFMPMLYFIFVDSKYCCKDTSSYEYY